VAIIEVVKTLFEAILLVFLVMYLFMGTMRATLIPTIAVPVVILGTFAVLGIFGFSINMLTMLPWFWPSVFWWTMPSWWGKTSSAS
jgi:HAE1 family hydrophobic/amphiphilic exporter-1